MSETERHPESYCHRCDGPNISWFTPGAVWDPIMRPDADGTWLWNEIICPLCFVELAGGGTWHLIPGKADGESWTGADERARIIAEARAAALREAADALGEYADETYWRDDSPFHAAQNFALGDTAADWLRERADRETP